MHATELQHEHLRQTKRRSQRYTASRRGFNRRSRSYRCIVADIGDKNVAVCNRAESGRTSSSSRISPVGSRAVKFKGVRVAREAGNEVSSRKSHLCFIARAPRSSDLSDPGGTTVRDWPEGPEGVSRPEGVARPEGDTRPTE